MRILLSKKQLLLLTVVIKQFLVNFNHSFVLNFARVYLPNLPVGTSNPHAAKSFLPENVKLFSVLSTNNCKLRNLNFSSDTILNP